MLEVDGLDVRGISEFAQYRPCIGQLVVPAELDVAEVLSHAADLVEEEASIGERHEAKEHSVDHASSLGAETVLVHVRDNKV